MIKGKENIKKHYQEAEVVDNYTQKRYSTRQDKLKDGIEREIIRSLIPQKKHKILEIAPGKGRITKELAVMKNDVTVFDSSEPMLNTIRLGVKKVLGDAFEMPFEKEFDGIVSMRFIRHLDVFEREIIYRKCNAALKKGGYLIYDMCNKIRHRSTINQRPVYDALITKGDIYTELRYNGFGKIRIYSYLHGLELLLRLNVDASNFIQRIDRILRVCPGINYLGYLWIIYAEKVR